MLNFGFSFLFRELEVVSQQRSTPSSIIPEYTLDDLRQEPLKEPFIIPVIPEIELDDGEASAEAFADAHENFIQMLEDKESKDRVDKVTQFLSQRYDHLMGLTRENVGFCKPKEFFKNCAYHIEMATIENFLKSNHLHLGDNERDEEFYFNAVQYTLTLFINSQVGN